MRDCKMVAAKLINLFASSSVIIGEFSDTVVRSSFMLKRCLPLSVGETSQDGKDRTTNKDIKFINNS